MRSHIFFLTVSEFALRPTFSHTGKFNYAKNQEKRSDSLLHRLAPVVVGPAQSIGSEGQRRSFQQTFTMFNLIEE